MSPPLAPPQRTSNEASSSPDLTLPHRLLEEAAAANFDLPMDAVWLQNMTRYADTAIARLDPTFAAPLFDRLAPYPNQVSTAAGALVGSPVSHFVGGLGAVLGHYDEADTYFRPRHRLQRPRQSQGSRRAHQLLLGDDARRPRRPGRQGPGSRPP